MLLYGNPFLNQAGLYFDPSTRITGLKKGHNLDVFKVSLISYELGR